MNPRAYSYIRFSTAEQLKGKSLERQTEAAAVYAAQHGLTLDTSLSLKDLGVSAFRGKNAAVGALGVFLARVADGTVPKGSFLLIETFDRMSRQSAYDAQLTLQNIVNAGVTVVTLLDGKQYSVQILRNDPLALIYAILLMSRSHEESATKSKRIGDGWARKRQQIRPGETYTRHTPLWIRVNAAGKTELIPARAKLVRQMFDQYLAGDGAFKIAVGLNEKKVPTWTSTPLWQRKYISRIVSNRATVGEFQPGRSDMHGRRRIRMPDGPPVKDYFPPVVSEDLFDRVQAIIQQRVADRGPSGSNPRGLLSRLATCPACGSKMERTVKRADSAGFYVCAAARVGKSCAYRSVMVKHVDTALVNAADVLYAEMPMADPGMRVKVAQAELALVETDKRLFDLAMLLDDNSPPKTITARIRTLEVAKDELAATLADLKAQALIADPQYVRDRAKRMRDALSWHSADPSDAVGVNLALRECFAKVVVNYLTSSLECVWKHGPTTVIAYSL